MNISYGFNCMVINSENRFIHTSDNMIHIMIMFGTVITIQIVSHKIYILGTCFSNLDFTHCHKIETTGERNTKS